LQPTLVAHSLAVVQTAEDLRKFEFAVSGQLDGLALSVDYPTQQ
jgi:hypothetical protein